MKRVNNLAIFCLLACIFLTSLNAYFAYRTPVIYKAAVMQFETVKKMKDLTEKAKESKLADLVNDFKEFEDD